MAATVTLLRHTVALHSLATFSWISWEVLNGVGVDGAGVIFPLFLRIFSLVFRFSSFFFAFLRFSSFFFAFLFFS